MNTSTRSHIFVQVASVLLLLLATFLVLYFMGAFKPKTTSHRTTFQVDASGGYALITLKTAQDMVQPAQVLTVPWRKEMTLPSGTEVYLTAANPSQTGELSCTISLDNQTWKTDKKQAPQDGVACAGIVP